MSHTIPARANVDLIDQKYVEWKEDPNSVDQNWAMFFEGFELGLTQPASPRKGITAGPETEIVGGLDMAMRARIITLVESYRTLGHTSHVFSVSRNWDLMNRTSMKRFRPNFTKKAGE